MTIHTTLSIEKNIVVSAVTIRCSREWKPPKMAGQHVRERRWRVRPAGPTKNVGERQARARRRVEKAGPRRFGEYRNVRDEAAHGAKAEARRCLPPLSPVGGRLCQWQPSNHAAIGVGWTRVPMAWSISFHRSLLGKRATTAKPFSDRLQQQAARAGGSRARSATRRRRSPALPAVAART